MSEGIDPPPSDGPDPVGGPDPAEQQASTGLPPGPLPRWRVPPRTPVLLCLVAVVCVLWNVFGQPSIAVRVATVVLAVACLATAVLLRRTHLLVEPQGVAIRFARREEFLTWGEIAAIDVIAGLRGTATIRFRCVDGSQVDVPPSIFQPTAQSGRAVAARRLEQVAASLRQYWKVFGGGQAAA